MSLASLLGRWDIDSETQASVSFERAIALVNLRRIEVVCLLAIFTDALSLVAAPNRLPLLIVIPGAALCAVASRQTLCWTSLRAQQAVVVLFFTAALLFRMGGSAAQSINGFMSAGYLLAMLTMTMLFALRPLTLGIILFGLLPVYAAVVTSMPFAAASKTSAILNAAIVAGIALVAGIVIYSARRNDFVQKRLIHAQNVQLIEQNHELDQLMAITAHDLRSPLYGLRNLLDLATRRAPDDPALAFRVMRDGIFSLDAMLALVTRLLDAHSAEHAALAAKVHEDVRGHLLAAARRIAPAAEAASVAIAIDVPEAPLVARFDRGALAQILDNLLSNAVRFSPSGAKVRLAGRATPDAVAIEIEDHGPGFDSDGRDRMFSKFGRVGAGSGKAGTGMGLFIAATFAERTGATLAFRDAEPNGAIFTLTLREP